MTEKCNNQDLISVIIPVYNVRQYLVEALDSVCKQTYQNLEILIIDDGSTDGSSGICDEYARKDSRIKVVHQKHGGVSAARNTGFDLMSGNLVAFLDSDDAFLPDMLRRMLIAMKENDADIVVCKYGLHYSKGKMKPNAAIDDYTMSVFPPEGIYTSEEALALKCEKRISGVLWDKLYKVELFQNVRCPVGRNYEDLAISLPLIAASGRVYVLNERMVMHRKRPGSITMTMTVRNLHDWGRGYRDCVRYVREQVPETFSSEQLQMLICSWYRILMRIYYGYNQSAVEVMMDERFMYCLNREIRWCRGRMDFKKCDWMLRIMDFSYCFAPRTAVIQILKLRKMKNRFLSRKNNQKRNL